MIEAAFFYKEARRRGVGFFTGVPDSLLKSLCAYIGESAAENEHVTAVNEGAALALAAGYHLATGKIPLVYMQNSGIGNAVNPLLSLCDAAVCRVPALIIIGWRGEPGVHDEPQHITQGRVQEALLDALELPHAILAADEKAVRAQLDTAFAHLKKNGSPYALVVRKDAFAPYAARPVDSEAKTMDGAPPPEMSREEVIEAIISAAKPNDKFFATTGMASRELYELREKRGEPHHNDFLTVGAMGHTASIALSFAMARPDVPVTCIDGDGAALMHLGALAEIGYRNPYGFWHFMLNNGAHDSVGGQPTIAFSVSLPSLARGAGYCQVLRIRTRAELNAVLIRPRCEGAAFFDVHIKTGARPDLGRPAGTPEENKRAFMAHIGKRI